MLCLRLPLVRRKTLLVRLSIVYLTRLEAARFWPLSWPKLTLTDKKLSKNLTLTERGCIMSLFKNPHLLSVALILPLLVSCANSPKQLEIVSTQVQIPRQIHSRPAGVVSPSTQIVVVTPARAAAWNIEVAKGERKPYVVFGHNEQDYLTFASWLQDVLRYIKAQTAIIDAYEDSAVLYNQRIDTGSE